METPHFVAYICEDTKSTQQDCVTECETNALFVRSNLEVKLDQSNSDTEEELYSDCLEQFDDQSDRINEQTELNSDNTNDRQSDKQSNRQSDNQSEHQTEQGRLISCKTGNELLSVIEEEDSLEKVGCCLEQQQSSMECVHQNELKNDTLADECELKLRVKVEEGSTVDQQVDNEQVNEEQANSELNFEQVSNETSRAVRLQEQVMNKLEANFVKPKRQGDQVTESTAICSPLVMNSSVNDSQQVTDHLKRLKVRSPTERIVENDQFKSTQPPPPTEARAKSIKTSESPSIHFQQRVSVVKQTFENKVQLMMHQSVDHHKTDQSEQSDKVIECNAIKVCPQTNRPNVNRPDDGRQSETETKIAREIREFKEREEELKRIRLERLNKENLINCTLNCLTNCTKCCTNSPKNYLSSSNSTSSADSISLNRSDKSSDKSSDRSSDRSSDKSSDKLSDRSDSPPVTNDQCSASIDSLDEGFAEFKSPNLTSSSKTQSIDVQSPKSDASHAVNNVVNNNNLNNGNPGEIQKIQKILATTRIQQEIEEQTRRELALKAAGSIKTISQERTDKLSISNLLGSSLGTSNVLSPTLSLSSLASSLSSLNIATATNSQSTNSTNQTSDLASSSSTPRSTPIANQTRSKLNNSSSKSSSTQSPIAYQSNAATAKCKPTTTTTTNLYTKNTNAGLLKHRTFSTSHLNNLTSSTGSTSNQMNLFKMNQTGGRHISMHRFISTKGKTAIVDTSSSNAFSNVGHSDLSYSYTDLLRPPKIDPITAHKIIEKKCLLSADYKISSELRDLHQREEELR